MRFTILSDEGAWLGTVSFEDGRFESDDPRTDALAERAAERFRELRSAGGYDDVEHLIRAVLERVSGETGARFVRDAAE